MKLCSEPECNKPFLAKGLCKNHYQRMRYPGIPKRRWPRAGELPIPDSSKVCLGCGEEKQLIEFAHHGSTPDGRRHKCRKCLALHGREWRKQNARHVRSMSLKKSYGISIEDRERMLAEQHGACAICRVPEALTERALAVDHDHVTGKVRGLLCTGCNVGIGNFSDDPSRLSMAAKYLLKGRD